MTVSEAEARVYLLLRQNRSVWYEATRIADATHVTVRTVQRCLSRLVPDVAERQETRPAPRYAYRLQDTRGAMAYSKRLEAAVVAYGIEKEGRTGT